MAETINDLYLKYVNEVGGALEDDRYFRYLYEMVQAGNNTLNQQRQVLHKVVDERWLSTIEEALDALNKIVENPRRFIERNEEVVPVALAKKITADSVRHLSQNTQFIASSEDGNIQPTHILNVSVQESYNLYENRFIYHLIQRLVTFIDKRTDVIFWSTGDETQNVLTMESKVDDAYEQINYKIEMKIKNLQNFAENDSDNMSVFMRIDRVRRLVMALKNSSFCEIMAGCQKVRSPIQRTNLLTKDRDYRVCYALWGFLETYDEVGYTIEVEDQVLQIDEEYLIQMYTNLITNYTVFKSVTDPDKRDMDQLVHTKRRQIRPRFITEVQEEEVASRDIPEVEIKKVFVEEVTQAQLDAEAALAEERELREQTEEMLRNTEKMAQHNQMRVDYALSEKQAAEELAMQEQQRRQMIESKMDSMRMDRDDALMQLHEKDQIIAEKDQQIALETKDLLARIAEMEKTHEEELTELQIQHDQQLQDMQEDFHAQMDNSEMKFFDQMNQREEELNQEYDALQMKSEDALEAAKDEHEHQMQAQTEVYEKHLADKDNYYEAMLDSQQEKYEEALAESREAFSRELQALRESYEKQIEEQGKNHEAEVHSYKTDAAAELSKIKDEAASRVSTLTEANEAAMAALREQTDKLLAENRAKSASEIEAMKLKAAEEVAAADAARKKELAAAAEESTAKYEALRRETAEAYDELKTSTDREIAELKASGKARVEELTASANAKESALTSELEQLKRELAVLRSSKEELEGKLKAAVEAKQELEVRSSEAVNRYDSEHKLREQAEERMENALSEKLSAERELAVLKAVEDQVKATTVSEFRRALRAEKKARSKK